MGLNLQKTVEAIEAHKYKYYLILKDNSHNDPQYYPFREKNMQIHIIYNKNY